MRWFLACVLFGVLILTAGADAMPTRAAAPDLASVTAYNRARDAFGILQARFVTANGALYVERLPLPPTDPRYARSWPFSQAAAATLDIAGLPGGDREVLARAGALRQGYNANYWDATSRPPGGSSYPLPDGGGDKYYDDNAWVGLNLVELYRATGDRAALTEAARTFAFVVSGWDSNPAHPSPGGVFWTQAPGNVTRDRNTVSTAPTAELALHLYAYTGDGAYLDWARRLFDWVERTLKDPADGLYWDRIQLNGVIEKTKWSYNQGTMLGAAALFYRYTGDTGYLGRAREIATASLAYYGGSDRLWTQDPAFNAIYFRNLQLLALTVTDDSADQYRDPLSNYVERAWAQGRDSASGLFHFGRSGPSELLNQAAAVQLHALLATTRPGAEPFADPAFRPVWARGDAPVAAGAARRTWLWGPGPDSVGRWERFDEGLDGRHLVQYFDKSRMEINDPNGDRTNPYVVTQGLLAADMILGRVQVGLARFEQRAPAAIPFGDPDDRQGPTYASLAGHLTAQPGAPGQPVTQALRRDGSLVATDARGVQCGMVVAETRHCIASVFWEYLNSSGPISETANDSTTTGPLFAPLFYATGLPIAEPYWTELKVGGRLQPILVQAFERRILTYNPANAPGWQVEMGNVGRHYYQWRYGRELPAPQAVPPR